MTRQLEITMRLGFAADHAGYTMKEELKGAVSAWHEVIDFGTHSTAPVDYPDIAEKIALAVRDNEIDRGILLCGSGIGACVAANKVPGVRAGLCHDAYAAHQGVEHDDIQILVLGARVIGIALAKELLNQFLKARFTGEERHARRLSKIQAIEERRRS